MPLFKNGRQLDNGISYIRNAAKSIEIDTLIILPTVTWKEESTQVKVMKRLVYNAVQHFVGEGISVLKEQGLGYPLQLLSRNLVVLFQVVKLEDAETSPSPIARTLQPVFHRNARSQKCQTLYKLCEHNLPIIVLVEEGEDTLEEKALLHSY